MEKPFDGDTSGTGVPINNATVTDMERSGHTSEASSYIESTEDLVDATKLSPMRKLHIVVAGFTCTFNGNLGSSMPSGALDAISEQFDVSNRVHLILLNSLFMCGYVLGPLLFGPLSEYIGRRPVLIGTYLGYFVFMLACSGAPNYPALLVFRLLSGINAAAPTTVIGGLYADILDDPAVRGNAMAVYMTVTTVGPLIGPIVSGFSSPVSWRWPFWIAGIIAACGLPLVLTLPETYAPVLHNKAAKRQMKRNKGAEGKQQQQQQQEQEQQQQLELKPFEVRKIFLRPMKLLFTEPILLFTSAYLTLAYAVFYLLFQAYPVIFQGFYGLSPGMAGLAFLPVVVGVALALVNFWTWTWYHDRETKAGAKWTQNPINRRLPLACMAAPLMVIALFWLGWTVWPSTSPVVSMLSGILFGWGFNMLFMGMINYLTDVFRQYSASAHAAASMTRSIGAILLPLAADSMYADLGVHWAPSLLGFVALAMGTIPFIFIRFGDRLSRSSKTAREAFAIKD
ncbi:major facilitator superfamily transporter [Colletotrichum higginsianum]|uniref:Major facilitator superfamily transporter n=2 Tax=Colletotrichum higginsianum TaxID=80884 RepID=H1VX88_COLHI|nr:Major facilitator superfamily transporter [Colletotrichum higginsianum IMI 349063]OBR11559.1 Major facilitator superfamily transporter [Colletotrichum higginsianum IMI 349063]TIC99479.1 putative transporter [Colletotrichum higginsianum]CCF44850.1 major facilitator superfamily transporter [Colletotrichum higginsianum]